MTDTKTLDSKTEGIKSMPSPYLINRRVTTWAPYKKHLLSILFAITTMFSSTPISAQQYVKNNLPCLAEICLGDGLDELQKIKWEPAFTDVLGSPIASQPAPSTAEQTFKTAFIGRHGKTENYLVARKFDSLSLKGLPTVKVACESNQLVGNFISSGGNPTEVTISLGPMRADSTDQQWVVIMIRRRIPKIVTEEQAQAAFAQLDAIYNRFNPMGIYDDKRFYQAGLGIFMSSTSPPFGFMLTMNSIPPVGGENNYKRHPACGGKDKISLD
jgi:hypothetical protein